MRSRRAAMPPLSESGLAGSDPLREAAFLVAARATELSTVTVSCDAAAEQLYRRGIEEHGGDLRRVVFRHRGRRGTS